MSYFPKRWVGLGLAAALMSTTALTACGGEGGEAGEGGEGAVHAEAGEAGEGTPMVGEGGEAGEGEGGEAGADHSALPVEHRAAFMWGHAKAGTKLYRDGFTKAAATHLMHPVSETHASEREGLDALGFEASLFEVVSDALAAGTAASEIEDQLEAAEENLRTLNDAAGGDPADVITFLLDTAMEEYQLGVANGVVTDAGEYQDAWGFVQVASEMAEGFDSEEPEALELQNEIRKLADLWPASIDGETPPASVSEIASQISVVRLVLSAL